MANSVVLLTGGTGLFGKILVEKLEDRRIKPILISRKGPVRADLSLKYFGWKKGEYDSLAKRVTHILHAAATTRFTYSLEEARKLNVEMTRNVLDFAQKCPNLQVFGHVSTAFVAGKRIGTILESELEHGYGSVNTYEQSKYETELMIKDYERDLPMVIFRPSIINSSPALKLGMSLLKSGMLPVLPGDEDDRLDIMDGKMAAGMMVSIFLDNGPSGLAYHITRGEKAPRLGELIKGAKTKLCGSMDNYSDILKSVIERRPDLKLIYDKTSSFLPILAYPKIFDNRRTHQ